ncbi:hypothetical protein LXL04_033587 [Taraxacum kok-saghyz]
MVVEVVEDCGGLFEGKKIGDKQVVWLSHGDEAVELPEGFKVVARRKSCGGGGESQQEVLSGRNKSDKRPRYFFA